MHAKSASVTFAENCRSDSALALHSRNSIQEYPVLQTVPLHAAKSESPQRKLASALLSPLDTKLTKGCSMQLQLMMPAGKLHSADIHSAGLISPKLPISPALSPMEDSKDSFTPYYMSTAQPRAPELQRSSYAPLSSHKQAQTATNASHISSTAAAESPAGLASPGISTGQLTPNTGNNSMELDGRLSDVSTATRIRRSLSTLLTRSSSMLLRKGNSSDSRRAGKRISQEATIPEHTALISSAPATPSACLPAIMVRSSRATSANRKNAAALSPDGAMQSSLANHSSDAALPAAGMAFSSSRFNLAVVNGIVSPLIRNSMVHLKVVMNANTIVIVPMVRTEVFARARERILTKLFWGGVSFVESKRRKLVVRRADGSHTSIEDNRTWRKLMEAANHVSRQNAIYASATAKTVVKLTLHLMDPQDIVAAAHEASIEARSAIATKMEMLDTATGGASAMPSPVPC